MMFKPLSFDFPEDDMAKQVDDQLLLGNEIMIAPVYKQNAQGRYVYLPEEMIKVSMKSCENVITETLSKGHHYVSADLDELVFFIRKDRAIPFGKPVKNTSEVDLSTLKLIGFDGYQYELYYDDGYSTVPEDSLKKTVL